MDLTEPDDGNYEQRQRDAYAAIPADQWQRIRAQVLTEPPIRPTTHRKDPTP